MTTRGYSIIAGVSYLIIFCTAIYANFFVLDGIIQDPVTMVTTKNILVRLGILCFLIAAVFDVFVAWALSEIYKNHPLTSASTYFRIMHATIMGAGVFALVAALDLTTKSSILVQLETFNNIWLVGLFFFGVHLILLANITKNIPLIPFMLLLSGIMYIIDTSAHFLLPNYNTYADVFLMAVAIPSIFGEMAFALWLLLKNGKKAEKNSIS